MAKRDEIQMVCDLLLKRNKKIEDEMVEVADEKDNLEAKNWQLLNELRNAKIDAQERRMRVN